MRFLVFALALFAVPALAQSTATYEVVFESTWSATTHPDDFPPNPHFSGLVGATHTPDASLWSVGGISSPGMERMAETGSKTILLAEADALVSAGHAGQALSGGFIGLSPGSVAMTFTVTSDHPAVTLVSMIAPSPDWFVGTEGLDLRDGSEWQSEAVVDLYVYDAGTDSGPSYTSPDLDTQPREPIARIDAAPFVVGGMTRPVGTYTFSLQGVVDTEEAPSATGFALSTPSPNPAAGRTTVTVSSLQASAIQVRVTDMLGRMVAEQSATVSAGQTPVLLSTTGLAAGLYIVTAASASARASTRLVVR